MLDQATTLSTVCAAVEDDDFSGAAALLASRYPFTPLENVGRRYSAIQSMQVFVRDGFIDRYCGRRLVFPGTLRLLSILLPADFPFHSNWKTNSCHFAFWELFPTIDHLIPVSRGGTDQEGNWVSTSMVRNAGKANFTIEELGWRLSPPGDINEWDGLTGWFSRQFELRKDICSSSPYLCRWAAAAKRAFN